jgi:nitroreductase
LWIGLSSVHWREAWKYGERAFRYCQLDLGHAIAAVRYAAAALGWTVRIVYPMAHHELARLLGLDRERDFGRVEREEADLLLDVAAGQREPESPFQRGLDQINWAGTANILDSHPMYCWPVIEEVCEATRQEQPVPETEIAEGGR